MKKYLYKFILIGFCTIPLSGSFAKGDGTLSLLGDVTLPCPAAALNAAAARVKKISGSSGFFFSSFGPTRLNKGDAGSNIAYGIGFNNNLGQSLNYRIALFCVDGNYNIVTVTENGKSIK
jgi:hypothetical protein